MSGGRGVRRGNTTGGDQGHVGGVGRSSPTRGDRGGRGNLRSYSAVVAAGNRRSSATRGDGGGLTGEASSSYNADVSDRSSSTRGDRGGLTVIGWVRGRGGGGNLSYSAVGAGGGNRRSSETRGNRGCLTGEASLSSHADVEKRSDASSSTRGDGGGLTSEAPSSSNADVVKTINGSSSTRGDRGGLTGGASSFCHADVEKRRDGSSSTHGDHSGLKVSGWGRGGGGTFSYAAVVAGGGNRRSSATSVDRGGLTGEASWSSHSNVGTVHPESPSSSSVAPELRGARFPIRSQPEHMQVPDTALLLEHLSFDKRRLPVRPGFGLVGRKTSIKVNHFRVDFGEKDPYQYDVNISPEVTSKTLCRKIIKLLISKYRVSDLGNLLLAYDGNRMAYAADALPFNSKEFDVKFTEQDGLGFRQEYKFKVTIKFAEKVELCYLRHFLNGTQHLFPQRAIQAFNVVLGDSAINRYEGHAGYAVTGRSVICDRFETGNLGGGVKFVGGFHQSLRPLQMGLSLNCDALVKASYKPILVSAFVGEFLDIDINIERQLTHQQHIMVKRVLRGAWVEVSYPDYTRRYKVKDLTRLPLSELTFIDRIGATVSVASYHINRRRQTLEYTWLPAVQAGTKERPTYLPMEICKLADGQCFGSEISTNHAKNLTMAGRKFPMNREPKIMEALQRNDYNNDDLVRGQFGMQVTEQFTSIDARVLPSPALLYGGYSRRVPQGGEWTMKNLAMFNGGTVDNWAIVNFSDHLRDHVIEFFDVVVETCLEKSMHFNRVARLYRFSQPDNIEATLEEVALHCQLRANRPLDLLFVVLPETEEKIAYGNIKRVCETKLGIISQCCRPQYILHYNPQYITNFALKINLKVGGKNSILNASHNHTLECVSEKRTIIFGADVSHPLKFQDSTPSIASVVASIDWPDVSKYKALVSAQSPRLEIIRDLYTTTTDPETGLVVHGGMIRELISYFAFLNIEKPERIIFYRDGVSDVEFERVLLREVDQIKKACLSFGQNYNPSLTFIVVQKKHHTRFFPQMYGDLATTIRSGNVLPGTVVDTKICHPTEFDFFLCSHAAQEGTSRPVHYYTLHDENKFSADRIQNFTNKLCYMYARCTRSVSIVAPVYYAHLAAYRARFYMEDVSDSDSLGGQRATRDMDAVVQALPEIHSNVKDKMFYC